MITTKEYFRAQRDARLVAFDAMTNIESQVRKLEQSPPRSGFDAVLIEPNPMIRELWELASQGNQIRLLVCANLDEFLGQCRQVCRSSPIYLAAAASCKESEEQLSTVWLQGFWRVFLTTENGLAPQGMRQRLRCLGKIPPWPVKLAM